MAASEYPLSEVSDLDSYDSSNVSRIGNSRHGIGDMDSSSDEAHDTDLEDVLIADGHPLTCQLLLSCPAVYCPQFLAPPSMTWKVFSNVKMHARGPIYENRMGRANLCIDGAGESMSGEPLLLQATTDHSDHHRRCRIIYDESLPSADARKYMYGAQLFLGRGGKWSVLLDDDRFVCPVRGLRLSPAILL
jgi:hypothetical protein